MPRQHKFTVGLSVDFDSDIQKVIENSCQQQYDFVCMDVLRKNEPRMPFKEQTEIGNRLGDNCEPSFFLNSHEWSNMVVGKISSTSAQSSSNAADDQANIERATDSNNILDEINYCQYLGLPAILVELNAENCVSMARVLNYSILKSHHVMSVWVRLNMCNVPEDIKSESPLAVWNRFRTLCNHSTRISLALNMPTDLSDSLSPLMKQWLGEPVRCVFVDTSIFVMNGKGYPVLSLPHQHVLDKFFNLKVQCVVSGKCGHKNGMVIYYQYLDNLYKKRSGPDQYQAFTEGEIEGC